MSADHSAFQRSGTIVDFGDLLTTLIASARQVRIIDVEGPLRVPLNNSLRHEITSLVDDGLQAFVLDLSKVAEIDAAGVGELVHLRNLAVGSNGTFRIVNPTAHVRHVLNSVGLLDLLTREHV